MTTPSNRLNHAPSVVRNAAGLAFEFNANGSMRRLYAGDVVVNLFPGNEMEGGPANLWLRLHRRAGEPLAVPLLGPRSPLHWCAAPDRLDAVGAWGELHVHLALRLAADDMAWFWHVRVENRGRSACRLDLIHAQDVGLAPYAAIRTNEFYVSHYIDLTPLAHADHGWMVAARQNQAVAGRHPWALFGSLRRAVSFATDALQVLGLSVRDGGPPAGLGADLPGRRLQHEHALAALQDEAFVVAPGAHAEFGFFGCVHADHPAATSESDFALVAAVLAHPAARAPLPEESPHAVSPVRTLFCEAPMVAVRDLDEADLATLFGPERRHAELADGALLSFFHGEDAHVVLRAKELRVQRPHGHILRTGAALVPDEGSLTSTVWMAGVFHSMVTQGHVSINRFLSTTRGWLGQFRSQGLRVFISLGEQWQLLGVPSAFEMQPNGCRWLYRHDQGLLEVSAEADRESHVLRMSVRCRSGTPPALLVCLHVALAGDDGADGGAADWRAEADGVFVRVPAGSELAHRFPQGGFFVSPASDTRFAQIGGDEMLFEDGGAHGQPFVCIRSEPVHDFGLEIRGRLLQVSPAPPAIALAPPRWHTSDHHGTLLAEIVPWYLHDALVHYLSPRGLEQYSGGGWGTRDVCQGPLEMLLALNHTAPVRDLLLRVFAAQNADGDWPQWFMFFERERALRAGDSHGDIVFWPLLGLARYLLATEDAALLDTTLPFHDGASAPLWAHVERALAIITARRIPGTQLAAYGHGDWNDSLQPVDQASRERLCSGWTVTLHHQVLTTLAQAMRSIARTETAAMLDGEAAGVLADFRRLLVCDGVVAGYAMFEPGRERRLLLHPQDEATGVHYGLLSMMHAVINDMLSPQDARAQLELIERHLLGPDGARLFDRPLAYRGGPQRLFQRAESSAFFGREIGVMYMHAHLRYAEMLAHLGEARRFFRALGQAHPILLRERVPSADLRQANCYFSSSDAAFADRYDALSRYDDVSTGRVPLDGGWRIYSSGPGIAIALLAGRFLGLRPQHRALAIDPVMPPELDGLHATWLLDGRPTEIVYRVGPAGHGVTRIVLNGCSLSFDREVNAYRVGAALVTMADVRAALRQSGNRLEIALG